MKTDKRIKKYRSELNQVDQRLFSLCHQRIRIAKKISKIKKANKIKLLDLPREIHIKNKFYKRIKKWTTQKKSDQFIQALFELNSLYPSKRVQR